MSQSAPDETHHSDKISRYVSCFALVYAIICTLYYTVTLLLQNRPSLICYNKIDAGRQCINIKIAKVGMTYLQKYAWIIHILDDVLLPFQAFFQFPIMLCYETETAPTFPDVLGERISRSMHK